MFKVVSAVFIEDTGRMTPKLKTIKTGLKRTEAYKLRDKLSDKLEDFDPNTSKEIVSYMVTKC